MNYSKQRAQLQQVFTNLFKIFTDNLASGDPKELTDALYARFIVEDFAYGDPIYYQGVFNYFEKVVIPHKIEVFKAGMILATDQLCEELKIIKTDFVDNLFFHDLSKFSANEAFGYAMHDFKKPNPLTKMGFEKAWHHHKMNNAHHPEHWLNPNRSGELEILPMPKIYVLEMVADWIGAGKTYGSTLEEWLPKNIGKFKWHNETATVVQAILEKQGIKTNKGAEGSMLSVIE